jgi:hypothetical protein
VCVSAARGSIPDITFRSTLTVIGLQQSGEMQSQGNCHILREQELEALLQPGVQELSKLTLCNSTQLICFDVRVLSLCLSTT